MVIPTQPNAERVTDVTFFEPWQHKESGAWKPGKTGAAVAYESFADLARDLDKALETRRVTTETPEALAAQERAERTARTKGQDVATARRIAAIDAVKGGLLAFSPACFTGNERSKSACERVTVYAADHDGESEATWSAAVAQLNAAGVAWYAYGTPKDGIAKPGASDAHVRRRLLIALSRDVTPRESARLRKIVPALLGLTPDASTVGDEARLFYVGAVDDATPYSDGADVEGALDVDAVLASASDAATPATAERTRSKYAGITDLGPSRRCPAGIAPAEYAITIARTSAPAIEGRGGHTTLFGVACDLVVGLRLGADDARALLWREYNPRCVPPWSEDEQHDFDRKVDEAEHSSVREPGYLLPDASTSIVPASDGAPAPFNAALLDETRQGVPRPTHRNVLTVLEYVFGDRIRYDEMRGRILCAKIDRSLGHFVDGIWTDTHTTELTILCETHDLNVSARAVDRAVDVHAKRRAFNPLQDELVRAAANWDRVPRVDTAMTRYWGATDCAATRAVARVFLLSLAARGLRPGCKVDTCPVFIGPQGCFKSTSLEALAGGPDRFADSPLPIGDKDALQNIRGKWLWELGELASLTTRDLNAVKAFLSQKNETYRKSYGTHSEDVARTCVFAATTNDHEVFRDPTGERRYLPVRVGKIDVPAIRLDREQLLGEAAFRVIHGEAHYPSVDEATALLPVIDDHRERDTWEDLIAEWIAKRDSMPFKLHELLNPFTGAIPMAEQSQTQKDQRRASAILRRMGYETQAAHGVRVWCKL